MVGACNQTSSLIGTLLANNALPTHYGHRALSLSGLSYACPMRASSVLHLSKGAAGLPFTARIERQSLFYLPYLRVG